MAWKVYMSIPARFTVFVVALVAVALSTAVASATAPQLRICYENRSGQCAGQDGWFVQTTSVDACGGALLWASRTGQYSGVWVDDSIGDKRQSIINCEHGLGKPTHRIFVGLWEYETTLPHFAGAMNIAEYYPFHGNVAHSLRDWWGCPNRQHDGFLTQWYFSFHNDTPPTARERDTEWWTAISCIPRHGWFGRAIRSLVPMGVY